MRTDGRKETTPDDHASDLQHLIDTLGAGPVDIFASSGGAVNALSNASTRIVVGNGEQSGEQFASRAGRAVASRLGIEPVRFPSHHAGFLSGQQGDPEAFAARLREVLSA